MAGCNDAGVFTALLRHEYSDRVPHPGSSAGKTEVLRSREGITNSETALLGGRFKGTLSENEKSMRIFEYIKNGPL